MIILNYSFNMLNMTYVYNGATNAVQMNNPVNGSI